jgi:hypothetical protein
MGVWANRIERFTAEGAEGAERKTERFERRARGAVPRTNPGRVARGFDALRSSARPPGQNPRTNPAAVAGPRATRETNPMGVWVLGVRNVLRTAAP